MTGAEGPQSGINHDERSADAPGWALPTPSDPPLTEVQRDVVEKIAEAQREHGKEDRWRRSSRWNRLLGIFGLGAVVTSTIDSLLASRAEMRAKDAEREAQFLAELSVPRTVAETKTDDEPHPLPGGPPSREEIYEAEMHPWPHHGMAETIEHLRALRKDAVDVQSQSEPPED